MTTDKGYEDNDNKRRPVVSDDDEGDNDDDDDGNAEVNNNNNNNGDDEDDDDDDNVGLLTPEQFIGLLDELSSTRPDVLPSKKRNELIQQITDLCIQPEEILYRQIVGTRWNATCSSPHAYRRIATLYTICLSQTSVKETTVGLCRGLCRLLQESGDVDLLETCESNLLSQTTSNHHAELESIFYQLAIEQQQQQSSLVVIPAVALGSAISFKRQQEPLLSAAADETTTMQKNYSSDSSSYDWCGVLLQHTVAKFSNSSQLLLARTFIQNRISANQWKAVISPALQLKLKSHPDKALETLRGWMEQLGPNIAGTIDEEWTTLLLKHLTSAKDTNPITASKILISWSKQSPACDEAIVTALAKVKAALAPARVSVYETLRAIAAGYTASSTVKDVVIQQVLEALIVFSKKEPKPEHRLPGLQAIVEWLVVAKRSKEQSVYSKVLDEFIQQPILTKKLADAGLMLTLLVRSVHPDLLELIATDLWTLCNDAAKVKAWEKALEAAVESAATKKALQVEGLLVLYFTVLYTDYSAKPLPAFATKMISAGSTKKENPSFIYSKGMLDALSTNDVISMVLPRVIALYTKLGASSSSLSTNLTNLFPKGKQSAAARTIAVCCIHPTTNQSVSQKDQYASNAVIASLETILTYQPGAAEGLSLSLLEEVNACALQCEHLVKGMNETREARETDNKEKFPMKGQGRENAPHSGYDANAVRRAARLYSRHLSTSDVLPTLTRIMILTHAGTSLKSDGHQRAALILNTLNIVRDCILPLSEDHGALRATIAEEIIAFASSHEFKQPTNGADGNSNEPGAVILSDSLHKAALSLLVSLGGIASNYQPDTDDEIDDDVKPYVLVSKLCQDDLSKMLSSKLTKILGIVEDLTQRDIEIFLSPIGTLIKDAVSPEALTSSKRISGKHLNEDEEWELQLKKELEEKKKRESSSAASGVLSEEDKKLIQEQDRERERIGGILNGDFLRTLDSIRFLCSSDIEVGNKCLPIVSESVLKATVSVCPAVKLYGPLGEKAFDALTALGACVYEILEVHAPTMATALTICCRKEARSHDGSLLARSDGPITVSPLPSPCAPAACVIYEMDQFHDTLSGASFAFLFPVIQACLMGIRTPVGCEGALRVLNRHTALLADDEYDPVVASLRKDMAVAVLEILKFDRVMAFHDPTAFETLVECYRTSESQEGSGPPLTTGELAPLLDERGALGTVNCRIAALRAISCIAEDHRKFIKANPLIENRVWLNCWESDESIRNEARKAWSTINDVSDAFAGDDLSSVPRPSPLYAAPLLPLLSHSDSSVAKSAAVAYAHAMGMHPNTVSRNIEILCKTYIDSFPTLEAETSGSSLVPKKSIATAATLVEPPKKKTLATGLPKKKAAPKSALDVVSGIGKPKVAKKKAGTSHSEFLKPKQERTLDQDDLANMFKAGPVATKTTEEKDSPSKIAVRSGVIRAIAAFSNSAVKITMDEAALKLLTSFLMAYGIADSSDDVKGASRNALRDVVASNGGSEEAIAFLMPHLEAVLKTGVADESSLASLPKEKVPKDVSASDRRKEGAVVALGSVALHLQGPENEEKVDSTVDMLLAALKTPSEEVQQSVADALTKLMKKGRTSDRVESIINALLKDCLHNESLAARRGAAYGLSAVVKGTGIAMLKKYEIVKQLEESCSSGSSNSKEGALFAIELLSSRLGLLFEPYVIVLLPSLLKSFSDSSDHVRDAANLTTGLIMSKLSAHGVKLVMPAVLTAFNDPAWRTKQASIRMLGAMSHLAPKQLASALPKVVPKLTEAFSDTHAKVKATAQEALNEISTVIKNPEVSSISTVLLKALTDPADYTIKALEALIETEFLHAIDAPSLALIAPILHRGLRDRGATTKRFGGLIAGNICTMINDPKDFVPYLPTLLPDIQTCLLDPIPDVRSTSAKALGSLTRSLGDHILPEIRPWLIQKLRDEACSSAERSGAAQGLTEVLIASGSEIVEETMRNEILPLRSYPEASTREGVLWMLSFLPPALGQGFTPLIDVSLPALINGLSDDSEPVRDVAMRAGRVLIRSHGKVHVDKILPSLEAGLGDDDHRIRVASLSLLGDLLSMIGGTQVIRGEGDTQDDIRKAERAQVQIALALGSDTRKRVLSGLYLARCDTVHVVRQSALQVWKTVVSVTARTLRDILPVLVSRIIDDLASGNEEKTEVAGRCLGDLVSKLGDSVLPQIIPVLRNALYDGNEHTKRGVCVGLTEVINCSTRDQILKFIEIIIKVVQDALSDDNESVRRMAASSFQSLHSVVGSRALDEVVPSLMVALENDSNDEASRTRALNGLIGILSVRSRELLPYIIPKLIARPMTLNHADALAGIAEVTGATIHFHFGSIIPVLLSELSELSTAEEGRSAVIENCAKAVCGFVDDVGVNILISEIASKCSSDKAALRAACCQMFDFVVTKRAEKKDFYDQIPIIIRELIYRLNDENTAVLKAANVAFTSLSRDVPAEDLVKHVEFMRNLLASMVSDSRRRKGGVGDGEFLLPGFNMPKGVEPLIPIYVRGILFGDATIREVSAAGLGEIIVLTSEKFLASSLVVKMTGPLLRVVGDRNPANVKIAILKTLGLVLIKGGPALRAFVPQFQTTFVKALSDPSRQVRVEAIHALRLLMPLSLRVDPLIKELVSGSLGKNVVADGVAAAAVQTATLDALAAVLERGGDKAKLPDSITSALDCSKDLLVSADLGIREAAAKVMGACCALLGPDNTKQLLRGEILASSETEATLKHGRLCAVRRILSSEVGSKLDDRMIVELKKFVVGLLSSDKESVREASCVALGAVIGRGSDPKASMRSSESEILKILNNSRESIDIHRAMARGLCVALMMINPDKRIEFMGLSLLDSCLQLALTSSQRVQFAFNDVLWLALDVQNGQNGLDKYCGLAVFDNQRSMKSLHSKVLVRTKELSILEN